MKRLLFLVGALFLLVAVSAAQPWAYGVKGGISFPHQSRDFAGQHVDTKQNFLFGFHIGGKVIYQLPIYGFEMEGNMLLSRKGCTFKAASPDGSGGKVKYTQSLYYLDFPLKINYAIGFFDTGFFLGLGPTFSVGLWGSDGLSSSPTSVTWGKDDEGLNRFDIAISFQLGARFRGVELGVFYDLGLWNISNVPSSRINNRVFGISAGYLF